VAGLARHARHFEANAIELINHDVDGVRQFQEFARNVGL